jgi:uncharacterized protein with PQ loop repeat
MGTDLIGWSAAFILLLTISCQVYKEWNEGSTQGVSRWLFIGQLTASAGFVIYSWLLGSWVFVVTNSLLVVAAGIGQYMVVRNKRRAARAA